MWKSIRNNRVHSSVKHRNIKWSLQPIFYAMRIFGIDLIVSLRSQNHILLAPVSFAVFMWVNVTSYLQLAKNSTNSTITWIEFFKPLTWFIFNTGHLLAMMEMVTLLSWKPLWRTLKKIGHNDPTFHPRLRKLSLALTVFFIVLVSPLISKAFQPNHRPLLHSSFLFCS